MAGAELLLPDLQFSKTWHVLGPFRIGTREAVWGSNPLEALGGFQNLPVNDGAKYHSSLGVNGAVGWLTTEGLLSDSSDGYGKSIAINFAFPEVDWTFQQSAYGWAALQYQAFARGFINVVGKSSCSVALYTDKVLELSVNDKPSFGGDFYGFRRAPLICRLAPGENKIDLRLIRDVRSMNAVGSPSIPVQLALERCTTPINVVEKSAVLPDVINGNLASPYASVILRNESEDWINVVGVYSDNNSPNVQLLNHPPSSLAPGQSRSIGLWFSSRSLDVMEGISISFAYVVGSHRPEQRTSFNRLRFFQRSLLHPHKFTFRHPSGAVSYAILRPPTSDVIGSTLPILLNLHGAGLESDSHQARHMLDAVPELNAWVLFPTGMSTWSGDDWHVWGFADVAAAVSAIPDWIKDMNWTGPGVDTESWVVTGHSNGGQGAWFVSSHQPDKIIATAAVSGYSSIQNYVPYMWKEASPLADSIIQNSLSNYRHELLVENLTGTPLYQQHGAKDDIVPPYHSRLLRSLLAGCGCSSEYVELPKDGHWFEGVMTTGPLRTFYRSVLDLESTKRDNPKEFRFVIPNSHDIGSRAGIFIDQLQSPDYLGKLHVRHDDEGHVWRIDTTNIRRMHLQLPSSDALRPGSLRVDETLVHISSRSGQLEEVALVRSSGKWALCDTQNWKVVSARYGRQRGSLDAILRTTSCFRIQIRSEGALAAALQVSRNLLQYYAADAEISVVNEHSQNLAAGNIISLTTGEAVSPSLIDHFPIRISAAGITMRQKHTNVLRQIPSQAGLGAAFLRPLPDENLELILWGSNDVGLQQAVRMVPTLTGAGQPDFIVLGDAARWQGHAGVLAMGFFDHAWEISQASFIP